MSFFNLRRGGQSSKSTSGSGAPAESLEIVRKRAKHRLIGSAVLILLGVIGFPLLFDTQPRPVSVNIPVEIPSKQGVKPLSLPTPPAEAPAAAVAPTVPGAANLGTGAVAAPPSSITPAAPATPATEAAPAPAVVANEKSADKPVATAPKGPDDSARAKSLLDGGASPVVASADQRLVVQVGAFADAAKAREARLKLERAGLKTYTQVAETKDGKRIRVRVGPYATKAEADKAAKQIKALDLPAAILTL